MKACTPGWTCCFLIWDGWALTRPTFEAPVIDTFEPRLEETMPMCRPTHGIFRGNTESELYVAVQVEASAQPPALDRKLPTPTTGACWWSGHSSSRKRVRCAWICSKCSSNNEMEGAKVPDFASFILVEIIFH